MKQSDFDVIVVGGGHAGCEAAHAAARAGGSVALVTLRKDAIGVMSCNPAIGGLGKGHLVREIDALGGIMAKAADAAGIQFRLLNRRKGPAVQGPRAQSDRKLYRRAVQSTLLEKENLTVVEGEVTDIIVKDGKTRGVLLNDGSEISSGAVVLTTGTFLGGVIHIGRKQLSGGRMGEAAAHKIAARLRELSLPMGRLKTGTPPRLNGKTIRWDVLDRQYGDEDPTFFSFETKAVAAPQVSCGIAHTNSETHEIIRTNLNDSAMYGGVIEGVGPRYCPSIEDKVVRFAEKNSHQVFLEPEGVYDDTVYPNGISTSLPVETQEAYVRSIFGLEAAEILQPGYAIEYDYMDPRALTSALELPSLPGLFLAGQVNGTTGYEEAAAQGLMAGTNALLSVKGMEAFQISRSEGYIGVMIDDLTTKGVSEPYRMFTSRAEFRLSLRADNADQRLTVKGRRLGLVSEGQWERFSEKYSKIQSCIAELRALSVTPKAAREVGLDVKEDGKKRDGLDLLAMPRVEFEDLTPLAEGLSAVPRDIREQVMRQAVYQNYIDRQQRDVASMERDAQWRIPAGFDFAALSGLSSELIAKLSHVKPETVGQASRIEGMTPAATLLILATLKRQERVAS